MNNSSGSSRSVDSEIIDYYSRKFSEAQRLGAGPSRLEFLRTLDVLERLLPPAPAVVLDVGGAAGRYACWLAKKGHKVHLIDPVEKHIKQAGQASASQPDHPITKLQTGDARALNHQDSFADIILFMGPMYHLVEYSDRITALHEAYRVLKKGGLLVATAISRFAFFVCCQQKIREINIFKWL